MANVIIVAIIVVIAIFALKQTMNHMKNGCCGGGGAPIEYRKELKDPEVGTKTLEITGMHCDHCRVNVQNALNQLEGVKAEVDLKKNRAVCHLAKDVSDAELAKAVEDAGYGVKTA